MASIKLRGFQGTRPRAHASVLDDMQAQTSQNARIDRGTLRPVRGTTTIQALTVTPPKSIFKYTPSFWFEWNSIVNAVHSPVPNDAYDRAYFTGDGVPKVTDNAIATTGPGPYPTASYELGIPPPAAVTVAVAGTADNAEDLPETRYYVLTYVDAYGAEHAPSLPSAQVEVRPGQTVDVTGIAVAPTGNYNAAYKRLYRVNTGTTGSVYQYVTDIPLVTTSYNDSILSADLGEELPSTTYDVPPATLKGLVVTPGGYGVGYYDNVLCMSEPYALHAWPIEYQQSTTKPITGIGLFGNSVLVTTEENPYVAIGVTPETTTLQKLEVAQSCVGPQTIVDFGYGVAYASPDGVVLATQSNTTVVTQGLFTREDWQALNPSTMVCFNWEGLYIAFYAAGAALLFDPQSPESGVLNVTGITATGGVRDLLDDLLYLISGTNIVSFDTGSNLTYTWKSKQFIGAPRSFAAARVRADSYTSLTFKLYANGVLKHTEVVTSAAPFRLPSGFLAETFEVQLEGTSQIYEVEFATSMEELSGN